MLDYDNGWVRLPTRHPVRVCGQQVSGLVDVRSQLVLVGPYKRGTFTINDDYDNAKKIQKEVKKEHMESLRKQDLLSNVMNILGAFIMVSFSWSWKGNKRKSCLFHSRRPRETCATGKRRRRGRGRGEKEKGRKELLSIPPLSPPSAVVFRSPHDLPLGLQGCVFYSCIIGG